MQSNLRNSRNSKPERPHQHLWQRQSKPQRIRRKRPTTTTQSWAPRHPIFRPHPRPALPPRQPQQHRYSQPKQRLPAASSLRPSRPRNSRIPRLHPRKLRIPRRQRNGPLWRRPQRRPALSCNNKLTVTRRLDITFIILSRPTNRAATPFALPRIS